jgi:hypothetical protein
MGIGAGSAIGIGGSIARRRDQRLPSEQPGVADVRGTVGWPLRTIIVTAVRSNQAGLQLSALWLLVSLDAKLALMRAERSNPEEAAQYEDLKRRGRRVLGRELRERRRTHCEHRSLTGRRFA